MNTGRYSSFENAGAGSRGSRETIRDLLVDAEQRLARAGVASPSHDAMELAGLVLGVPRTRVRLQETMTSEQRQQFESLVVRRQARVPLQHLTGVAGFRRLELLVGPGVFVPRPETELVTEAGLRALPEGGIAVDLCAGSGAVALSLATERNGVTVHAVELDPAAAQWLQRNTDQQVALLEKAGSSVRIHLTDATMVTEPGGALAELVGTVDVVVTNPPYIPVGSVPRDAEVHDHDPAIALYGGSDGLDVIRGLLRVAAALLKPGGTLVVEHGDLQGDEAGEHGVPGLLAAASTGEATGATEPARVWARVADRLDLTYRPRFTIAVRA